MAVLGGGFILVAVLMAGLPPLSSFLAKFAIIDALLRDGRTDIFAWAIVTLMIVSGLAALVTMTRAGIDLLWTPSSLSTTRLSVIEAAPIGLLLATCVFLVIYGAQTMRYMEETARELDHPALYVDAVRNRIATEGRSQ